jgi:hypothetical protein
MKEFLFECGEHVCKGWRHACDLPANLVSLGGNERGRMSSPSLLACLPALTPNCLITNFDKRDNLFGEDDNALHGKLPAPREVFPSEVGSFSTAFKAQVKFLLQSNLQLRDR